MGRSFLTYQHLLLRLGTSIGGSAFSEHQCGVLSHRLGIQWEECTTVNSRYSPRYSVNRPLFLAVNHSLH